MKLLENKRIVITGVLNNHSIAYGIAQAMHREGAELAFTYQNEKLRDRAMEIAREFNSELVFPCDLSVDEEIERMVAQLAEHWDTLDGFVHAAAYAPNGQLEGNYLKCVTREGFRIAHDVSSYSLAGLAKAFWPMMRGRKAAVITLTHLGAERVITNYNVMGLAKASLEANVQYLASALGEDGIRVNGISAGAVRTVASSGIKDFRRMLDYGEKVSPLHRNVTIEEVGNVAAFLCSDYASGITGEIIHVDAGLSTVGFPGIEAVAAK